MGEIPDTPELIRRGRSGDLEAFTELVRLHQQALRAYLAGFTGARRDVVDDLAQESFLAAFRSLATYDETRSAFRSWLIGVARNRGLTWLRDAAQRRRHEGASLECAFFEAKAARANDEGDTMTDDRLQALDRCLRHLPAHAASLVRAHYQEGRSVEAIAELSGKAATAVRMALSRVRRSLRACIEQRLGHHA